MRGVPMVMARRRFRLAWGNHVVSIAAGSAHSVAVNADGSVVAWGNNNYGQTNVPPGLSEVVTAAAGFLYSVALRRDGTVVVWGPEAGMPIVPPGLSRVQAIACGERHIAALTTESFR